MNNELQFDILNVDSIAQFKRDTNRSTRVAIYNNKNDFMRETAHEKI
jgi:hypothetical protein